MECEEAIKMFGKTDATFKTVEQKMPIIREAIKILKVPFEVTKMLQKPDITLSDFYGPCLMMREKLKFFKNKQEKRTNLAEHLLSAFENRRSKMLDNQLMIASVYLDRRYSSELTENHIGLAKLFLSNLWARLRNLRNKIIDSPGAIEEQTILLESDDEDNFTFEKYFQAKELFVVDHVNNNNNQPAVSADDIISANEGTQPKYTKSKAEFLLLLGDFEGKFPIVSHESPFISFWNEHKGQFPEIFEIADIIFGITPSQAAVEISFSQFGYVFTCQRCNIASALLENILIIKLNKDIAQDVFKTDLLKVKTDFDLNQLDQE